MRGLGVDVVVMAGVRVGKVVRVNVGARVEVDTRVAVGTGGTLPQPANKTKTRIARLNRFIKVRSPKDIYPFGCMIVSMTRNLHPWNLEPTEAAQIQRKLREQLVLTWEYRVVNTIGGVD